MLSSPQTHRELLEDWGGSNSPLFHGMEGQLSVNDSEVSLWSWVLIWAVGTMAWDSGLH